MSVGVSSLVIRSVEEDPLSLAASRTGAEGAVSTVSMVTVVPPRGRPRLPATSVAVVVNVWSPSTLVLEVSEYVVPVVVTVPTCVPPTHRVTMARDSLAPVNVGVVSLVIWSLEEDPVSLAAVSAGSDGATGATVSIVTVSVKDADERFPAASATRTVIACTPSANALEVTVVVVLLPTSTPPASSVPLTAPAGKAIVYVGVVSKVMLSVLDRPLSLAAERFGAAGVEGAV